MSEPPDDIAASVRSAGVRTNSLPRVMRGYVDIFWETMPVRTKPEGWIPVTPGSVLTLHFLLLTGPVRCREGQTADDAVLTLIFLISTNFKTGATFVPSLQAARSALATRSVDEPANPDIHHQTNRQKNKQCGRAPVAHQRQRDAGDRHSANHHSHIY
jgi:hypothetical protein